MDNGSIILLVVVLVVIGITLIILKPWKSVEESEKEIKADMVVERIIEGMKDLKVSELRNIAKQRGISGYSSMNKSELLKLLDTDSQSVNVEKTIEVVTTDIKAEDITEVK
jgi:hypothetical protein